MPAVTWTDIYLGPPPLYNERSVSYPLTGCLFFHEHFTTSFSHFSSLSYLPIRLLPFYDLFSLT
jgi:hypothetical protein